MSRMRMKLGLVVAVLLALAGPGIRELGAEPMTDAELVDRFHRLLVSEKRLFKNTWFGIQTVQHPFDVWITQEIIFEVRPDVIVETGTYRGGSAALWATILEHTNPDGRVITIDIKDKRSPAAVALPITERRVKFIEGSSVAPETLAEVKRRVAGKRALVILDSAHWKAHVLTELRAYAPLVPVGSYLIVQDTHLGETRPGTYKQGGALAAVEMFLAETDQFEVDASRERLLSTNNHKGFLKRVR